MSAFEIWMLVLTSLGIVVAGGLSIWAVFFGVRRSDMEKMQEDLSKKTGELVDAKFSVLAAEIDTPISVLKQLVDGMKTRLTEGEEQFEKDGEKLHRIELKCQNESMHTRNWAMTTFATHGQLSGVSETLGAVKVALARYEERSNAFESRLDGVEGKR